jgi:hypothetical protein
MFSDKDFEDIGNQIDRAPDGIVDARDYHTTLTKITSILEEMDYSDVVSKMTGMMLIMNEVFDDSGEMDSEMVSSVITSLSFHIVNLLSNVEDEWIPSYFEYVHKDILSVLEDEAGSLPYWEVEESGE